MARNEGTPETYEYADIEEDKDATSSNGISMLSDPANIIEGEMNKMEKR